MDLNQLTDKAKQLFQDAKAQVAQGQGGKLAELLELAKQQGQEMTDNTAGRVAELYTEWTGKPATARQVQAMALKAGGAAVIAGVIAVLIRGAASAASKAGDSFEAEMSRFFADKDQD